MAIWFRYRNGSSEYFSDAISGRYDMLLKSYENFRLTDPARPTAAVDANAVIRGCRSYRDDHAVPDFDDSHPLIVYDGVCVLCSRFVRFVIRRDRDARFRFTAAQSPLGQALYRHYGLDPVEFETNLLIADGRMHAKMNAFAGVMARLPWPWRALAAARLLPGPVGRWLYDRIAKNRYRLFGRLDACMVPDADVRARFIG